MVTPTPFHRYNLDNILPVVARRVVAGAFASQCEIARSYGIHADTAKSWRRRAIEAGLITHAAWRCGIVKGQLARLSAAATTELVRAA